MLKYESIFSHSEKETGQSTYFLLRNTAVKAAMSYQQFQGKIDQIL